MLDVGCRMLDVGCWMLDVGTSYILSYPKKCKSLQFKDCSRCKFWNWTAVLSLYSRYLSLNVTFNQPSKVHITTHWKNESVKKRTTLKSFRYFCFVVDEITTIFLVQSELQMSIGITEISTEVSHCDSDERGCFNGLTYYIFKVHLIVLKSWSVLQHKFPFYLSLTLWGDIKALASTKIPISANANNRL